MAADEKWKRLWHSDNVENQPVQSGHLSYNATPCPQIASTLAAVNQDARTRRLPSISNAIYAPSGPPPSPRPTTQTSSLNQIDALAPASISPALREPRSCSSQLRFEHGQQPKSLALPPLTNPRGYTTCRESNTQWEHVYGQRPRMQHSHHSSNPEAPRHSRSIAVADRPLSPNNRREWPTGKSLRTIKDEEVHARHKTDQARNCQNCGALQNIVRAILSQLVQLDYEMLGATGSLDRPSKVIVLIVPGTAKFAKFSTSDRISDMLG